MHASKHLSETVLRHWLSLDMDAADEPIVESHLEQCGRCAQLLETLNPDDGFFIQRLKRLDPRSSRFDTIFDSNRTLVDGVGRPVLGPGMCLPSDSQKRWKLVRKLATGGIGEVWIADYQRSKDHGATNTPRYSLCSRSRRRWST